MLALLKSPELEIRLGAAECIGMWTRRGGPASVAALVALCTANAQTVDPHLRGGLALALGAMHAWLPATDHTAQLPSTLSFLQLLARPPGPGRPDKSADAAARAAAATGSGNELAPALALSAIGRVLCAAGGSGADGVDAALRLVVQVLPMRRLQHTHCTHWPPFKSTPELP